MNNLRKNWKTTLAGVISPADSTDLNTAGNQLINHIDGIIAGIMAVALIFTKDADK